MMEALIFQLLTPINETINDRDDFLGNLEFKSSSQVAEAIEKVGLTHAILNRAMTWKNMHKK